MQFARQLTIERLATWILFILLFTMAVQVPLDTDVWWHLRAGEHFLDEGSILREDLYSFAREGEDWVNHSWGAQIIIALAYRLTDGDGDVGDSGVIGLAFYAAIFGTAGMVLVYRMCAGNIYSRAFVVIVGASTAAVFWSARPQMVSFFLSTVVLYLLYLFKRHDKDYLWAIPPLMILWVNLHAGFALGFIILLGFLAGEFAGNLIDPDAEDAVSWRRLGKVGLVTLIGVAALSLNPYGPRMILYPFETAGLQSLNLFIQEWRSPDFKNPQTWPFILLVFGLIAARSKQRMAWSDLSLTLGTLLLALWASRNIALFAVVATPTLSRQVDAYLTERGWQIRPMKSVRGARLILNWALLILIVFGGLAKIATDLEAENVDEIQAEFFPLEALSYIRENPPAGNMLNNYNWGGLQIYTVPDVPVFVDGRTDLYGDDLLGDYFDALLGASNWRDVFEDYDIQAAFLPEESSLSTLLREDGEWQIVYEDEQAVIFEKTR